MTGEDENIALVNVKPANTGCGAPVSELYRQMSRHSPKEHAALAIKSNDLEQFSIALTKLATPLSEEQRKQVKSATKGIRGPHTDSFEKPTDADLEKTFPLPPEHEINQPLDESSHYDEGGRTLLFLSLEEGVDPEFCRLLIKAGARADLFNVDLEMAPIHEAVMSGSIVHAKALLETHPLNKANVDMAMQPDGQTALHLAAEESKFDCSMLELILSHSNNINAKDCQGERTPLYLAAKMAKNLDAVRLLLQHRASLNDQINGMSVRETILKQFSNFDPDTVTPIVELNNDQRQQNTMPMLQEKLRKHDLRSFQSILTFLNINKVSTEPVTGAHTIMQLAAMDGLHEFVEVLLKAGVDPNFASDESKKRPVLLAAEKGHWRVLETFKRYNYLQGSVTTTTTNTNRNMMVNFAVWTKNSDETVLHLALKRTNYKLHQAMDNYDQHAKSNKYKFGKRAQEMEKNYSKCLNVLLNKNLASSKSDSTIGSAAFLKQIRLIINKRDSMHNTPLHYATLSWPQQTVRKLLNNGANVGMKNIREEIPLTRIPPETLQDFLDENCMVADGYDLSEEEDIDTENENLGTKLLDVEDEVLDDIDCNPDFFVHLNRSDVTFKYGFLAPPITEDQLKTWDEEKQDDLEKLALPETDSLLYISQSKEHRHLVVHPVIRSYLWIKWKRMRKFYNRNVRVYLLFVMCLTWYIFAQFGGKKWEELNTKENIDYKEDTDFCKEKLPPILSLTKPGHYGFWYAVFVVQVIIQVCWISIDLKRDFPKKCGGGFGECCSAFISFCSASWIDLLILVLMAITLLGTTEVLWLDLTILFGYMGIRELLQMASSLTSYVSNLGNRMDIALLSLVAIILYVPNSLLTNGTSYTLGLYDDENNEEDQSNDCSVKRCMAATVILLSWVRLLTSLLRHPKWRKANVYLVMFKRIMHSFLRFLVWYAVLIVAFGLGFYIMLHKDVGNRNNSSQGKNENKCSEKDCCQDEPYGYFDNPWLALVKTSTMFVGEIEFSDIPIEGGNLSVTFGYLFLLSFIFLVVMVLMNLLNGLAVSDIAEIVKASEIEGNISTINTISYFESLLLGDPLGNDSYGKNNGSSLCNCLKRMSLIQALYAVCPCLRRVFQKIIGSTGMLLFFSYLTEKQMTLPLKQVHGSENDCSCNNCCTSCLCACDDDGDSKRGETAENNRCGELFLDHENAGCEEILIAARKIMVDKKREKSMEQKENRNAEIEEARRNEDRELLKKILAEQIHQRGEIVKIQSTFNELQRQMNKRN